MAKKKRLQPTAPVAMTRGQRSRAERERQQLRSLYGALIGVGALIVLILGLAVLSTYVLRPNAEVASVNGVKINRTTYDKQRRYNLFQQIRSTQALQTQDQTGVQSADTLMQSLQNVSNESTLDTTTVNQLVDNEVLRQKSKSNLGISASHDDLKAAAIKDFVPTPEPAVQAGTTPSPAASVTGTVTTPVATPTRSGPTNTPTVTLTPKPVAGAQQTAEAQYTRVVGSLANGPKPRSGDPLCSSGCPGLSENDYLTLIIEPRVLQEKVTDKLAGTVVTEVEQIHAQHILTDTEEGAKKIITMLDKGADFTKLANEQSSEQINNIKNGTTPNGGDLGWFPRQGSNFVQEFVDAAYKIQPGKYSSAPAKTQFGWHVIKVVEKDPKRPLSEAEISNKKTTLYTDWFTKMKAESNITTKLPPSPVVPTQPAQVEPTSPPVQASPTQAAGSSTGSASPTAGGGAAATPTAAGTAPTPTSKP